jgi:hypothetical protein
MLFSSDGPNSVSSSFSLRLKKKVDPCFPKLCADGNKGQSAEPSTS